jgi:hypothetical protein
LKTLGPLNTGAGVMPASLRSVFSRSRFQRATIQSAVDHQKGIPGTQIVTRKNLRNVQGHGHRTGKINQTKSALNIKVTHLPRLEQAARESIDKETSKEILHSKGVDLEFNMVSSQLAAMNCAAHLARSLAVVETNPRRKEFLQQTDHKFSDLHGQVYQMLVSRYQRQN